MLNSKEKRLAELNLKLNFWENKDGDFAERQVANIKRCIKEVSGDE